MFSKLCVSCILIFITVVSCTHQSLLPNKLFDFHPIKQVIGASPINPVNHILDPSEDPKADVRVHKIRYQEYGHLYEPGTGNEIMHGNALELRNPYGHFSIFEPLNNCGVNTTAVSVNARSRKCVAATNGGFFDNYVDRTTGIAHFPRCFGSVVSNSVFIQGPGSHSNVHFGTTSDRRFFTGYITKEFLFNHTKNNIKPMYNYTLEGMMDDALAEQLREKINQTNPTPNPNIDPNTNCSSQNGTCHQWYFEELVAGVVWLVRDGQNYVSKSVEEDDMTVQNTGSTFSTIVSARNSIGYTADGRLYLVTIDGKSNKYGIDLDKFADLLISIGIVQAINLDGGGSATLAMGGEGDNAFVVNYPSEDSCAPDNPSFFTCERKVSTITCIHDTFDDINQTTPNPSPSPIGISNSSLSNQTNNSDDSFKHLFSIISSVSGGVVLLILCLCMSFFVLRGGRRFRFGLVYSGVQSEEKEIENLNDPTDPADIHIHRPTASSFNDDINSYQINKHSHKNDLNDYDDNNIEMTNSVTEFDSRKIEFSINPTSSKSTLGLTTSNGPSKLNVNLAINGSSLAIDENDRKFEIDDVEEENESHSQGQTHYTKSAPADHKT